MIDPRVQRLDLDGPFGLNDPYSRAASPYEHNGLGGAPQEAPKKHGSLSNRIALGLAGTILALTVGDVLRTEYQNRRECPATISQPEIEHVQTVLDSRKKNYDTSETKLKLTAERYGFHLVDTAKYRAKLGDAKNVDEVVTVTNEFSKNFGFSFSLAPMDSSKDGSITYTPISPDKISLDEFRLGAFLYMQAYSPIPVEFIDKTSSIKSVAIVDTLGVEWAAGLAETSEGKYFIAIDDFVGKPGDLNSGNALIKLHETGHIIDAGFCDGAAHKDPQYASLNPTNFAYAGSDNEGKPNPTSSNWSDAVVESYGATNVAEDKATLYAKMLTGLWPDAAQPKNSVIAQKRNLLLARLEREVPRAVDYLADITVDVAP